MDAKAQNRKTKKTNEERTRTRTPKSLHQNLHMLARRDAEPKKTANKNMKPNKPQRTGPKHIIDNKTKTTLAQNPFRPARLEHRFPEIILHFFAQGFGLIASCFLFLF